MDMAKLDAACEKMDSVSKRFDSLCEGRKDADINGMFVVFGRKRGSKENWWKISRTNPDGWHSNLRDAELAAERLAQQYPGIEYRAGPDPGSKK